MPDLPSRSGMQHLLDAPRFELMPFNSFDKALRACPEGAPVTITASPQLGIEATIEASVQAARQGFDAVPHLAARYVHDEAHLNDLALRLADAGVTDLFVPAGDLEEPVGEFDSAHDLLEALRRLGHDFADIGITGYPEGHPFLDEPTLSAAMTKKAPYATYIVTQLCFDPAKIVAWIEKIRTRRDIDLPIDVGIPGVLSTRRLLKIARTIGVGTSIRFLRKTTGLLEFGRQLLGSWAPYRPDALVAALAPYATDPTFNLRGLHIYTFNQVVDTESWRREQLQAASAS